MNQVPRDLSRFGFELANTKVPSRLLVGTEGLDKTGKTAFGLSAPGPIGVINMDIGLEGVIHKYALQKAIWPVTINIPPVAKQSEYLALWKKVDGAYDALLANKEARTIFIDDGTQWWELARLAEFGQLSPAVDIKRAYGPLNQLFRSKIRAAYQTDKNFIMSHKVKELYKSTNTPKGIIDSWDGQSYKRAGFGEDGYLIQVNIEHRFINGQFSIRIINCRHNMALAGFELEGDECTFPDLASLVLECDKAEIR